MDDFDDNNTRDEFAGLFDFQRNNKTLDFIVDQDEILRVMNILKTTKTKRKWHEIVLWWEIRRIPYNIIMYFIGLLSFQIGYVTIPLAYLIVGFGLNVLYTLGWVIELLFINRLKKKDRRINYPKYAFISYLTFSTLVVFAIPILLLTR
jgi:hypothetical protein